jgi:hypothetical protein
MFILHAACQSHTNPENKQYRDTGSRREHHEGQLGISR